MIMLKLMGKKIFTSYAENFYLSKPVSGKTDHFELERSIKLEKIRLTCLVNQGSQV